MGLPGLIATDLDGTLLHTDGTVTAYTRQVLTELDARGVPVVFVTGRPLRWMDDLWHHVGAHGLAVCSNGGIVYDVARHEIVTARTIDPEVCADVGRILRSRLPGTTFALEKTGGFAREESFLPRLTPPPGMPLGPLEEIADHTVVKLLALHEELAPDVFWHRVEELVGDLVTTTWSSAGALIEMSAAGVTKASTLAGVAAGLGVDQADVIAFGDMPNDLDMLLWAGHDYAMGNAHPSVRRVATGIAPANDEDGVAVTLAGIFGLSPRVDP